MKFKKFILKNRRIFLLNRATEKLIFFLNFLSLFIFILYLFDYFFIIPRNFRILFFYFISFSSFIFLIYLFYENFLKKIPFEKITKILEVKNPLLKDDLTNAYQLSNELDFLEERGESKELAEEHIKKVDGIIENLNQIKIFENLKLKYFLIPFLFFISCFFVSFRRIINPFSTYFLDNFIEVKISRLKILRGEDVRVEVFPKKELKIGILYRMDGSFVRDKMSKEDGKFYYVFKDVLKDISFRFFYRDNYSKIYKVKVFEEPVISIVKTEYFYPEYTGKEKEVFFERSDLRGVSGTIVKIFGVSNVFLKRGFIKTSYGEKNSLKINKEKFEGELILSKSGSYSIEVLSKEGFKNRNPVRYSIDVEKDEFPSIEVVSPKMNLRVKIGEKIPLIYEAKDDFGIREVEINFKINEKEKNFLVKKFEKNTRSFIGNYEIDTNIFDEGETVYYYLSCKDNDTISGPKISKSKIYELKITSFKERHIEVQNLQKEIKEKIFNLLSKEMEFKEKFDSYFTKKDTESLKNLSNLKESYKRFLDEITEKSLKLIEEMKKDPYVNLSVFNEYRGMKENLEFLREHFYKKQIEDFKKQNFLEVSKKQESLIQELERLSLLSEEIMKRANMNDIISDAGELEKKAETLENFLKEKKWDNELKEKLNKVLKEINELMSSIAETLKNMPQDLPEDFVNKESVKKLDFNKMKDSFSKISNALKEGNLEEALREAQRLLKQIQEITKTLEEARKEVPSPFSSTFMDKLREENNKLKQLVEKEESLREETDYYERMRKNRFYKENKELIQELKKKFQQIFKKYEKKWYLRREIERAKKELDKKNLFKFKEIVRKIEERKLDKNLSEDLKTMFDFIEEKEEGFIDFDEKEKEGIFKLKEEQVRIKEETKNLKEKILKYSRETFLLPKDLLFNLDKAIDSMEGAEGSLKNLRTKNAVIKEDEAIYYLKRAGEKLKNSISGLSGISGKKNQSVAGFIQKYPSKGSSGMFGVREGYVELPGPEEFKQDPKLLEAIRESLKRKFPEKYKEIIREYFQKLQE